MATGSTTDDDRRSRRRIGSPSDVASSVLSGLVFAPGRSAAVVLVVIPYLWLGHYVATTAIGVRTDPIIGGDWLTLVFTTYALTSSLALAYRILQIGTGEATDDAVVDVVVLTWLTCFYTVWMLARDPVSETTAAVQLYGPVLDGQPEAVVSAAIVGVVAIVVAAAIHWPRSESKLFASAFRTALVTVPACLTAAVLLLQPAATSTLWPVLAGVFLGTLVGGLTRVQVVLGAVAKGLFATVALGVWLVGAVGWALAYQRLPPTDGVTLQHVRVGDIWSKRGDNAPAREATERTRGSDGRTRDVAEGRSR